MTYLRPATLKQALDIRRDDDVQVLAGGTDLFPAKTGEEAWGRYQPRTILDISALKELRDITRTDDHWRIGALATWSDVLNSPLPKAFNGLKLAAREVGGVQIQNRGTVAGNLCNASPAADGVPPLLTLDAEIELSSAHGQRRVQLDQFIDGYRHCVITPDELVTAILVPNLPGDARGHFRKLGTRRYLVISIAMVSAVIVAKESGSIAQARLALGSCSPVARRLTALEQDLIGQKITSSLGDIVAPTHLDGFEPIDDVRASAAYRLSAAEKLVAKTLDELGQAMAREQA